MPSTANYSWATPVVGGSSGTWGTILNTLFDDVDTDLKAVSDVADAAMPTAGGTFTGNVIFERSACKGFNAGSISGAVSIRVDDSDAFGGRDFQWATITGNVTFSFTGSWATSGTVQLLTIELTNGGAHTITWPAGVVWDGGAEPTLLSSGVDIITFYTRDGGTTVRGMHAGSFNS